MSGRSVTSDSVLASSVLPTPAGPSTSTGRPMRAARYTTVATRRLAMYRASRNRCWTSSTDWNTGPPSGTGFRFIVADSGRSEPVSKSQSRGAPRLGGGASEGWGAWGHVGAPHLATAAAAEDALADLVPGALGLPCSASVCTMRSEEHTSRLQSHAT